jgi:hypothetical protein
MTNSWQHHKRPTTPQLGYLGDLAIATGQTFFRPRTYAQASERIEELRELKRISAAERRQGAREWDEDFAGAFRDAASIRDDELSGHGSTASWGGGRA